MKKSVGSIDKIIRIILAIGIGYYAYSNDVEPQWLQIILYVVPVILVITSLTGFCPIYSIFGTNTCKRK